MSRDAESLLEQLERRQLLATIFWDGGPSGAGTDWNDPANWAGDVLPGLNDDALISVASNPTIQIGGIVNVRSVSSAEAMSITGNLTVTDASLFSGPVTLSGTLAGTGDCTFSSTLNWAGGVMAGPAQPGGPNGRVIISAIGSLSITGTTHDLNRTIENNGAATWTGGPVRMFGGTFNNNNAFTANAAVPLQSFGSGGVNAFNNIGTFTKLGVSEVSFSVLAAGVSFNSLGTILLQEGMLTLAGGGTMSTPLTVTPGAAFTLGDTYTFTGNGSINGAGTVNFTGGTHSLPAGRFNPTGAVNFSGGTVTISTPFTPTSLGPIGGTVTFAAVVNYSGAMTITGSASFAVAQGFSAMTLAGTLTGTGDVTVSGVLTWNSGTMSGSGKTNVLGGGSLQIGTTGAHILSRTLNSSGTALWTGGDLAFASGTLNNNGTFTVNASGTLLSYGNSGANSFVSNGSFTKIGPGEARFTTNVTGVAFNNVGTVSVAAGQLTLGGGGTASAAFNVGASGALNFAGNYSFQTSGSIGGAGSVTFSGGTQSVPAGLFNPTGPVNFSGGTVTINNSFTPGSLGTIAGTVTFTSTLLYSGAIAISGSAGFALPQTFTSMTLSGTLTGAGDVTVMTSLTWNAGSMTGAGKTIVPASASLTIGTGATHTLSRQLVSSGAALWNGGAIAMNGGTLTNNGTFTASAPTTLQCYGAGGTNVINNAGTFLKSGLGDALIFAGASALPFNNTGVLMSGQGMLSLGGGSTSTGISVESGAVLTFSGSFTYGAAGGVAGSGTVNFTGGTHTFAAGQFSVSGTVNFSGGTVTISNGFSATLGPVAGTVILNTAVTFPNMTLSGTISGTGDLTITGVLSWLGGAMSGTGKTIIPATGTLVISTGQHTLSRRVDVNGAGSWTGGDIAYSGGIVNIAAGRQFAIDSNAAIQATGSGTFNNAGTLIKSGIGDAQFAASGTVAFNNTGSVTVQDGTLTIGGGGTTSGTFVGLETGTLNFSGGYSYTAGSISGIGVVTYSGGTHILSGVSFLPTGPVNFAGGTVTINNAFTPINMGPIAGNVTFNAAVNYNAGMSISGSATFNAPQVFAGLSLSGTLAGSGDVTLFGPLNWTGGTMSGAGRLIIPGGQVALVTGASRTLSRVLDVSGQVQWSDGDWSFADGTLYVRPGATFTASPGASASIIGASGTNAINNQGSFIKSGSAAAQFSAGATAVALNNTGQVVVQDGSLNLSGGGSNSSTMQVQSAGTLILGATMTFGGGSISGAGVVTFSGGTHSIIATQFIPTGTVNFSGGTVTIGNTFTPAALGAIGATVTFQTVLNFSGAVNISGSAGFAAAQTFLDLTLSGTLTGAGNITVTQNLSWTGGAMSGTGKTIIPASAVMTMSGGSHALSRIIELSGTGTWTAGDLAFTGGTLNIYAGSVLTADVSATTSVSGSSGSNAFNVLGTFVKKGAGTLQFTTGLPGVLLNNTGTVTVMAGALSVGGGGITSGSIAIAAAGSLVLSAAYSYGTGGMISGAGAVSFTGGIHTITGGQLNTTGIVNFTGGTILVSGTFAPSSLGPISATVTFASLLNYSGALTISGTANFSAAQTFSGMTLSGTLSGAGDVTVAGALSWTAGTMSGTGRTIIPAAGSLNLSGSTRTLSRVLNLFGAATWTAGDLQFAGGTMAVQPGGVATVNTGPGITLSGAFGTNAFNIMAGGTLTKIGAGAFTFASTGTGVVLSNNGTMNAQVGSVNVGPWVSNFSANTLTGGTWVIENTGFLNFPAGSSIYTNSATVRMNGVNSSFGALVPLTTNAGTLTLADGRLSTFSPLGNLFTNTGTFTKTGTGAATWASTITVNNTGTINVSGGTLTLAGPVSQISGTALTGGSWNVSGGGILAIPGAAITTSNAVVSITGATSLFDAVNGLRVNNGSFTIAGGKNFSGTTFDNTFKLTVGLGSTMTLSGAFSNSFYAMIRGGTLSANGGGSSSGLFWFFDGGQLALNGTHLFTNTAAMSGAGGVVISGGSSTFAGAIGVSGMLNVAAGTAVFDANAQFGSVSNAGTLSLGTRTLSVTTVYTQGATASINLRFDSAAQFGRIVAGGAVTLAGTMNMSWGVGYVPAPGTLFNFITGTSRLGTFGVANLAPVVGRTLELQYSATGASLLVGSGFRPIPIGPRR